jgi:serine/threonine protein kinase
MTEAPLTQLGRYRIVSELGRGAMGVVYRAEDPVLSRRVAIKTILLQSDAEERTQYEQRFYQEAKAAGGLNHPNVVTIYDMGRDGDLAYMAMELLEGRELRDWMREERLPLELVLDIVAQVADGLAYAHENGIVHRDIKPGNIMVLAGRRAKLMDFGIARVQMSDVKTQAGALLGSPKYMSPEQVRGERVDQRSDIFSLGVVLFELVAGAPPFSGDDVSALMYQVCNRTAPAPSSIEPSLPAMLDLILAKALAKEPGYRYQSAAQLASDLRLCRAELGEAGNPSVPLPRAAPEVLPSLDLDLESTEPLRAGGEKTWVIDVDEGEATSNPLVEAAAALAAVARVARVAAENERAAHLSLSPRFDSAEAMKRLAERCVASPSNESGAVEAANVRARLAQFGGRVLRLLQHSDQRLFAAAIVAALAVAFAIAVT